MTPQPDLRYTVTLTEQVVFAADGQAVLFDLRDDGLHLLPELPWAVVYALNKTPATAAELHARLGAEYPDDDPQEQAQAVDDALAQLLDLGLIAPVRP
ncbi:MAG: HPr-rel-A system PqqD family peptide chaperone [Inhella sp.]|jgi:PqqD family protein of HPr-rel-A system|uniref:HPr-rel-A system PqqD family peptide chaperone n=1 Tax=Inhella sp. TaxID=1921806 RepID=UPI0022CCD132|nr:HPr-rel-A system PqqD family peptide chaperone [Inhella sp.]MCZ8236376.1 HPr-rel-A system PqqD family peptide chaperone [Inhella sp.]